MSEIVAFIGRAGSGKDYQCELLSKKGYKKLAFADALRDIAFSSLGLDTKSCMPYYDYMKADSNCIEIKVGEAYKRNISFRSFLEYLGTQGIRKYDNNFWVNALLNTIYNERYDKVCISDMRFANEFRLTDKFAKENGYKFKCIFCNYYSNRYQENNNHDSARLSNSLVKLGYKDLQELTLQDIDLAQRQLNLF